MKQIGFILLVLLPFITNAQVRYVLGNEEVVFSFESRKGKRMVLAKDTSDAYIVYRFGSREKIEMEFPEKEKNSWAQFRYSWYLRGGGIENAGLDLNYVYFDNADTRYVIYDTWSSEDGKNSIGVRAILPDKKVIDIPGVLKTRKGSLIDFRSNNTLEIGDELFD